MIQGGGEVEEVVFSGPMASGINVDMRRVLMDGFTGWAERWTRGVSGVGRRGSPRGPVAHKSGMLFVVDEIDAAGVPDHLAVAVLDRSDNSLSETERALFGDLDELLECMTARRIELRLYYFGIATLQISCVWLPGARADAETAMTSVRDAAARLGESAELFGWSSAMLEAAFLQIDPQFLGADRDHTAEGVWKPEPAGRCMWFHVIPALVVRGEEAPLLPTAKAVGPVHDKSIFVYSKGGKEALVAPNIGVSPVVSRDATPEELLNAFAEVVTRLNAYWAGTYRIGRQATRELVDLAALRSHRRTRAIRSRSLDLLDMHDSVVLFRSLFADEVLRLPPLGHELWVRLADRWNLDSMLADVEERQVALGVMGDRFLNRVQDDQTVKLNQIVLVLTLINAVGIAATLIDFSQGGALHAPEVARLALVAAFSAGLTVLAMLGLRWKPKAADRLAPAASQSRPGLGRLRIGRSRDWGLSNGLGIAAEEPSQLSEAP